MSDYYTVTEPIGGYEPGRMLREVTLDEARAMECNRCGDCCDGTREGVLKDEATGLPRFVWSQDRELREGNYEERFGFPLIQPLVMGDGGPVVGEEFEKDADGRPYRAFKCAAFRELDGETGECSVYDTGLRPLYCGEFPVFGTIVDDHIVETGAYIPPTGVFPRCTWHGLRIVGPWKPAPYWGERYARQRAGLPVPSHQLPKELVEALVDKQRRRAVV